MGETHRSNSVSYNVMNMHALLLLAKVAGHTNAGAGLWQWAGDEHGAGSIRQALDFLAPFATNATKWPFSQINTDFATWVGLATPLRQAARLDVASGLNSSHYEAFIAQLPWSAAGKDFHLAWDSNIDSLLWPSAACLAPLPTVV